MKVEHAAEFCVEFGDKKLEHQFEVAPQLGPAMILGTDFLSHYDVSVHHGTQVISIGKSERRYPLVIPRERREVPAVVAEKVLILARSQMEIWLNGKTEDLGLELSELYFEAPGGRAIPLQKCDEPAKKKDFRDQSNGRTS